jgi:hypothetical protein
MNHDGNVTNRKLSLKPSDLFAAALHAVKSHPIITVVWVALALLAIGVSIYGGMQPALTVALLGMVAAGALLLWVLWSRRQPADAPIATSTAGRMGVVAVLASGVLTFGIIQLVPYGRAHSNPPVTGEPNWANAETRQLMVDSCFACHSNEVVYPPYASIAPISWEVQHHVEEGRDAVNYSEFATNPGEAEESIEVIEEGSMAPAYFTRFGLHPEANLTPQQTQQLIEGLRATPGMSGG